MRACFPILAASLAATLAACAASPSKPRIVMVPAAGIALADKTPGFDDKEPDTCKSASLQPLIGQPSGNLRTVPLPGPVRIIVPGRVVDQDEYRSNRINAHIDGEAVITQITCG